MIKKSVYPKYGDEGKQVTELQKLLKQNGSKIQINGRFTIGVTTAIKSFQQKNGLKETGVVDTRTWLKLNAKAMSPKKAGGKKK